MDTEKLKLYSKTSLNADAFRRFFLAMGIIKENIDINKNFRIVLEHNPEKPSVEFRFYYKD